MPSCVVKWCRSHTDMKHSGISFHKFPTHRLWREKWIAAVRLERNEQDWMPSTHSPICSIHFQESDIYINEKRNLLKKSALPICTMVPPSPANGDTPAFGDLSGSSSITIDINMQEPYIKEEKDAYLEEVSCDTHENIINRVNYIKEEKDAALEDISCDTHENIMNRVNYIKKEKDANLEHVTCDTDENIMSRVKNIKEEKDANFEHVSCDTNENIMSRVNYIKEEKDANLEHVSCETHDNIMNRVKNIKEEKDANFEHVSCDTNENIMSRVNYIEEQKDATLDHVNSNTHENIMNHVNYIGEQKDTNLVQVNSNTQENIMNHVNYLVILGQPACSYVEEKRRGMMECPSCKYKFNIPTEISKSGANLPASTELLNRCCTPNVVQERKLMKKLTAKTDLAKKRLFKIKNLQRQTKRMKIKNLKLKEMIKNLKKDKV